MIKNFTYQPICDVRRSIILDTDIGPDCDDVGALAVLFWLQKEYGFDVPAIINCTSNRFGNGTLDALIRYCGAADRGIRIGQYDKPGFLDEDVHRRYNEHVANTYSPAFVDGTLAVEDGCELYRSVLENAEDDSVVLVTIGQFTVLNEVLTRYRPLIEKKVYALVAMAGCFPAGNEYNIYCDGAAGKNVLENFPRPVIYLPGELGAKFMTGVHPESEQKGNPIFDSYMLYSKGTGRNYSWDPACVLYAVRGEAGLFRHSEYGRIVVNDDGTNTWRPDENGDQRYLTEAGDPARIGEVIDEMIAAFDAK